MAVRIVRVADPDDPRLMNVSRLLSTVFVDPNTILGPDRLGAFLASHASTSGRTLYVLAAVDEQRAADGPGGLLGATIFSYVPRSNCGFSEYILSHPAARGQGIGRLLFDARKAHLDAAARQAGHAACNGLFIEAENPERTPAALLEAERETALDARLRLRLFAHLGFARVDVAYVQPPLGPGKQAVGYLDLLFAAWVGSAAAIPAAWVADTVLPIWRAWAPGHRLPRLPRRGHLRLLPV